MAPIAVLGTQIDRETLLDVVVNLVPVGILVFFVGLFLVYAPWGYSPYYTTVSHFLTIFPLIVLLFITYVSARIISRDEQT